MSTIDPARASPELTQRWRRQIGGQRRHRERRGPRPYAVISYVVRGACQDGLFDLRRVAVVVLQDAWRQDGTLATRFRSYAATAVPWGVKIGGAENTRFDKNLALAPRRNAKCNAFSLFDLEYLGLGLELDRYLERQFHHPRRYFRAPRLPRFWAAFAPEAAQDVRCSGPEFEASARNVVLWTLSGNGAVLFPLEHVSHEWHKFAKLMVDLRGVPKRQLLPLDHGKDSLAGFTGAVEFDLRHSRFSTAEVAST